MCENQKSKRGTCLLITSTGEKVNLFSLTYDVSQGITCNHFLTTCQAYPQVTFPPMCFRSTLQLPHFICTQGWASGPIFVRVPHPSLAQELLLCADLLVYMLYNNIFILLHTLSYMYMFVYLFTDINLYSHKYIYNYNHLCVCVCVCVCVYIYMHTHTHTVFF